MKVPAEVSLEGYQWELVHEDLFGLWFPRRRTYVTSHILQSTPEFRQLAAATNPGASMAVVRTAALPMLPGEQNQQVAQQGTPQGPAQGPGDNVSQGQGQPARTEGEPMDLSK